MKKKIITTILSTLCIAMCGCGAKNEEKAESSAEVTKEESISENNTSEDASTEKVESEISDSVGETKESSETSSEGIVNNNSEDTAETLPTYYASSIVDDNRDVRFYLFFEDSMEGKWDSIQVDVLDGDTSVQSILIDCPKSSADSCYFHIDRKLLKQENTITIAYTLNSDNTVTITRGYSYDPTGYAVYPVTFGDYEDGVDCYLAEMDDYLTTFVDTQGTQDIYSELKLWRPVPESYHLSDATIQVEIGLYRLTTLEGSAEATEDGFLFTCTEEGSEITGRITFDEWGNTATFTVLSSNFDYLSEGEAFEFSKRLPVVE